MFLKFKMTNRTALPCFSATTQDRKHQKISHLLSKVQKLVHLSLSVGIKYFLFYRNACSTKCIKSMNRWLQNYVHLKANKPLNISTQSNYDLEPILQKAKENINRKWAKDVKSNGKLSDFEIIKKLGHGSFSQVMLVRHMEKNRGYYAMKVIPKTLIIRENIVEHVFMEKKILSCIEYPFIIKYIAHFKDNANLFIVMEFVMGGEMHRHLGRQRKFEERLCKFYAAQIVLALEYLHFVGIIFRDLKPENILIDRVGYLKIADFGFAKKIDHKKTKTICGTPEYYAPEMLDEKPYSFPLDWYTLGILIYEMSSGRPPYTSSDPVNLHHKILDGQMKFPPHFSQQSIDIIQAFTKRRISLRLKTEKLIKKHAYFAGIDWLQIQKKKLKAPFIPRVVNDGDTQNFEELTENFSEEADEELFPEVFKDF